MASPETPLQIDLFTGDLVDTRSSEQKRRDEARLAPQQAELFSQRELAQFGVRARPRMSITPRTRLELAILDPRTDEEKARDVQREAEKLTGNLFEALTAPLELTPLASGPVSDESGNTRPLTDGQREP